MRGIRSILAFWALAFAATVSAQLPYAPAQAGQRIVYRGFTLIDGTGAAPATGMAVITNGERIETVLPAARLTPALIGRAEVIDLTERYVLPGLIDSHQHRATPPDRAEAGRQMRRDLAGGITAARIMADDIRLIAELDRAARAGEIAGPDFHYAALVAGRSFFSDPRVGAVSAGYAAGEAPWAQAIDAETNLEIAIARARGTGATAIKIYADLPSALVRRITDEAHRQGLMVWAHFMVFPTLPTEVVAADPDSVSHSCYAAYQLMPRPPQSYRERVPVDPAPFANGDNPQMAALFQAMQARGILLDATLTVYEEIERRAARGGTAHCTLDLAARLTAQAHRAGVLISAGTDADATAGAAWPALFGEMELLVGRAGFTPLEAIRAATQVGAMSLGKGQEMGVIAHGYLANMIVLERDPSADIANMRSVLLIVKRGHRLERRALRP